MTPKHCDLWINQGEDWRVDVLLTGIDCIPLDLTGFTFDAEAKLTINEYTKTKLHVDVDFPETGWVRLWLDNSETSRLPEITKGCSADYLVF